MSETQTVAILRRVMGGLVFDAVFEETHESELEVTDSPVETGVTVSDHAYMKPRKLTLSAGVSNVLLHAMPSDAFASDSGRAVRAFDVLTELQKRAEPFDVQTGLKLYTNMICSSLRTSQDKDTADVLIFTATLREVLIVSTQTVTYPPRKKGVTARQAGAKKQQGEQQGKEVKGSLATKLKVAIAGKK